MKKLLAAAIITAMTGAPMLVALAQTGAAPAVNPDAATPAVATTHGNNSGAPAAGSNSFTEAQAKSAIEKAGYSGVSALTKDKDGLWRGTASKAGRSVSVALDYQGNVVSQ
jgi:hypothetical protein